jgi:hypothetical protein
MTINEYQIRINSSITYILVFAYEPIVNTNIYPGNHLISQVSILNIWETICYILITADGRSSEEIKLIIGQTKTDFIKKKRILVSRKISRGIKKTFIKNLDRVSLYMSYE